MNEFQIFLVLTCLIVFGLSIAYVFVIIFANKRILKHQEERLIELKKSEQRYKTLFENSVVGMVKYDSREWQVFDANQAFFNILGVTSISQIQDYLRGIPSPVKEGIISSLRTSGHFENRELYFTDDNGKSKIFLFSGRLDNQDMMVHAVCIDITEKKRLENVYIRAQKMETISLLTNSLAHDLQNILAPILLSVDLLKKQVTTPSGKMVLKATKESANDGIRLIKNILSVGRGVKIEWKRIHLGHLIDHCIQLCNQSKKRSIKIITHNDNQSLYVNGDESQLTQVFLNLLHNAKESMPKGGTITIEVNMNPSKDALIDAGINNDKNHFVWISITDTGGGISKSNLQMIFEPFFTTKKDSGGTGLGLSIVHRIIKNHDGYISVKSELNRGTIFNVFMPLLGE